MCNLRNKFPRKYTAESLSMNQHVTSTLQLIDIVSYVYLALGPTNGTQYLSISVKQSGGYLIIS